MNVIIYGNNPPKVSFTQSPDGIIDFRIDNKWKIYWDKEWKDITWFDFLRSFRLSDLPPNEVLGISNELLYHDYSLNEIIDELKKVMTFLRSLTESDSEKTFFDGYITECFKAPQEKILKLPALIPQVWVNWIHYDPKDAKRAQVVQKEPFRVDFMMKDSEISQDLIIIEIDGASHFGKYFVKPSGQLILEASMDSYTQHLRKDRWLRKQGWKVFRVSSQELENCGDFNDLFIDLFDKLVFYDFPF